jgi:hypothetical protein
MKHRIDSVKTLAQPIVEKLKQGGVETFEDLHPYLKNTQMLDELSRKTSIEKDDLRPILGMADLNRLGTLEPKVAEALVHSGVHSVGELREQKPEQLMETMKAASEKKRFETGDLSTQVTQRWIEEAKTMEPAPALR